MTLKYESEIIKEIVDMRGHESSLTHYESECIESWIDEVKGGYPKLVDYQSEWLNYIVENPLGEFPYVTLSDVTEATVYNVVPYAYRSAVLKGQTLVNSFKDMKYLWDSIVNQNQFELRNDELIMLNNGASDGRKWVDVPKIENIKPNTLYTLIFTKSSPLRCQVGTVTEDGTAMSIKDGIKVTKTTITTPNNGDIRIKFNINNPTNEQQEINLGKIMLLEGDYTQEDIPYSEGMQSVKMPVLTTVGKNLFKGFTKYDYTVDKNVTIKEITNDSLLYSTSTWSTSVVFYIPINGGKSYITSANTTNVIADDFYFVDELKQIIGTKFSLNKSVTSPINAKFIKWHVRNANTNVDCLISNFQLEESTSLTSYEPYKSNILTVNEDVTLRSNGDICDELNLLTGQLTQRIGEDGVVLSQEVVKTVDLSCINEQGESVTFRPIEGTMHLMTEGDTIKPLFSGEIPVEAITQNLTSFIEE